MKLYIESEAARECVLGYLGWWQETGEDIVDETIIKVESLLNAPSDGFMKQVALVESDYGKHPNTFVGGSCGIWQVDPIGLMDTQDTHSHPALKKRHEIIFRHLGIDWKEVTCKDMGYPVLGAIAARLYILNIPQSIPDTIEERAVYWKQYYNSAEGAGTAEYFKKKVLI